MTADEERRPVWRDRWRITARSTLTTPLSLRTLAGASETEDDRDA